jgi:GT2 family glycosyltransferase
LRSLGSGRQGLRVEIIVVDNASTDGAADMVAREFPHVVLVRNRDNRGFSAANNQAAARARAPYLFFLNNDTLVPPGALRRLRDYARQRPEIGLIGPRLCDERGRPQLSFRSRPTVGAVLHRLNVLRWTGLFRRAYRNYRGRDGDLTTTRRVEVLMGAALFMPRRVFRLCGPWDESYVFGGEDIDLCARVGQRFDVIYHPDIEIIHYGRVSSRQHIGYAYAQTLIGITHFLGRNGSRPAVWFYKAGLTLEAPLEWLKHAGRYLWCRLRGRDAKAERSRFALRGLSHFLAHDLFAFWKA